MDTDQKIALLQKSFLFADMPRGELEAIAQISEEITLPAHTIFIHENDEADAAHIVDKGSLKIYTITIDGKEIPLNIAGHGDTVGEMAIIDEGLRSANVETLTETHMLVLHTKNFRDILAHNPHIAVALLKSLSNRIRTMDKNFTALYTESTTQLTLTALKTLAQAYENNEIPLTHEDLAKLVGATRPRITEALHELEKLNCIEISPKKIIVK